MMKVFKNMNLPALFCGALLFASVLAFASDSSDFEGRYLRERVEEIVMPESCGSPYREAPDFIQFYHATLLVMAAGESNSQERLTDLFAVLSLRERMRNIFPNIGEESPIDRLIIAQLCNFEGIEKAKRSSPAFRFVIAPTSNELHGHLVQIAPRLYQDSRKLMVEALAAQAKERKKFVDLERQWGRIQKLKSLGEDKIKNLFDESSF
ncbi:hypothetical protein GW916_15360 [bacterium]|nr:hypothetical protein [bacterium]